MKLRPSFRPRAWRTLPQSDRRSGDIGRRWRELRRLRPGAASTEIQGPQATSRETPSPRWAPREGMVAARDEQHIIERVRSPANFWSLRPVACCTGDLCRLPSIKLRVDCDHGCGRTWTRGHTDMGPEVRGHVGLMRRGRRRSGARAALRPALRPARERSRGAGSGAGTRLASPDWRPSGARAATARPAHERRRIGAARADESAQRR